MHTSLLHESLNRESSVDEILALEEPPLVIDLDGTLIRSDLLVETGLMFLRDQPHRCLVPFNGCRAARLPSSTNWRMRRTSTCPCCLTTAQSSNSSSRTRPRSRVVGDGQLINLRRVAQYLSLFDQVIATGAGRNLSAHTKRDALVQTYGDRGFDYAGNSRDDLPVWAAARQAYLVNATQRLRDAPARSAT